MFKARVALLALLLVAVIPAASARANAYSKVLGVYEANGSIPPCTFSSQELDRAVKEIDTYDAQYFQDFTNAIQSALAQRASGACANRQAAAPLKRSASGSGGLPVGSVSSATGADLPAPILLMALVGLAIAIAVTITFAARWRGWEPSWAQAWRHSWREAEHRGGGVWAEFRDWLSSRD